MCVQVGVVFTGGCGVYRWVWFLNSWVWCVCIGVYVLVCVYRCVCV